MSHGFQNIGQDAQANLDIPVEGTDFERGTWNGMDRFQCLHCPWDTTYPERIIDHFRRYHKLEVDRPIEATLFDADGHKIERIPLETPVRRKHR